MSKLNRALVVGLLIAVALSCKWLPTRTTKTVKGPVIDFTSSGKGLDVQVQLDKKQTATGKVSQGGGSVSLTAADGSKFTLDVPANAVETDTTITMTAVKSLDGAPLSNNTPTAVQLEPSGLFFKEMATLTIVPAKEIPTKEQIIFSYEGDGQDYHLAVIDPKSKEIKIKLMHFSGAGVGSGSDSNWAATLQLQADSANARLAQELGKLVQPERRGEDSVDANEVGEKVESLLDQFEEQVVLKEIAAAELDCKHARKALQDLLYLGRLCRLSNVPLPDDFAEKVSKLEEIARKCSGGNSKQHYRVSGQSNNASFNGEICGLDKPFTINVDSKTGKWPMNFTPESESAGRMEGTFSSNGCTLTGGGPYTILIGEDGSGTITFTYNSTATCPAGTTTTSRTSTLLLKAAPELKCP